jgi:hypothetical protein
MSVSYHIIMRIKTQEGFEPYGKFFIGDNRQLASELFAKLKGTEAASENGVLHMDLVTVSKNGLPVSMRVLHCTLEQLADNCKLITKEVFKLMNLEDMRPGN